MVERRKDAIIHLGSAVEVVIIVFMRFISPIERKRIPQNYMIAQRCYIIMFASILIYMRRN